MDTSSTRPIEASSVAAFVGCTLIWGSTFLFIRIGHDSLPPMWAAALRLSIAAAILFAILAVRRERLPGGAARTAAVGFGLLQFGVNFPLLYWGELAVPSGLTAVIFATIPVSGALLAAAFGVERLSPLRLIGGLVSLAGIAVVFSSELRGAGILPMLAVFGATIAAVLGSLVLKSGPRQSPIAANAVGALVGAVVCIALSVSCGESRTLPGTTTAWLSVLYLAIAGSVGAFVLWAWLVNRWEVSRVSFMAVLTPLIALSLGALVRHERLGPLTLLGAAIVLAGVLLGLGLVKGPRGATTR
ncbi:MAG: EamA family transporter [Candidatus Eisenbacteria bacterium]|uniref:EamA family transporter n=1 Tax=Eiseniibacteriota bacterium TaxID=2212470 RepID=A0A849SFH5_UNCEI|nr:EamA family transporter [Candidatus Eisenbacteria bacterium]